MKYREVAKLSLQQEKDILDSLIEFAASGEANMNNGSSRVVFCGIDAYTYDLLKDFVPTGRNVVVKINMGSAGVIQSQQERDGEIVLYDYGYFSDSGDECVNDSDDVWRFTQDAWLSAYLEDLIYNYGILELDDMKEIAATIEDCYEAQ